MDGKVFVPDARGRNKEQESENLRCINKSYEFQRLKLRVALRQARSKPSTAQS